MGEIAAKAPAALKKEAVKGRPVMSKKFWPCAEWVFLSLFLFPFLASMASEGSANGEELGVCQRCLLWFHA